jgi:raffinose/stachyose/melibiose transport system permease protein
MSAEDSSVIGHDEQRVARVDQHAWPLRHFGGPLYLAPALVLYGSFVLWPVIDVCWLALQRWNGYGPQTFVGLGNVGNLLGDSLFRNSLAHSALWEVAATLIPSVLALGLALLIARSRARSFFLAAFFFPALLPATVVATVWILVYSPASGLLNTLLRSLGLGGLTQDWLGDPHLVLGALFVAWLWSMVGIGALILWAGIMAIGREYVELALVEGAGPLWRFRHVTLPGLRRAGLVVLLVNATLGAQVFDLIFVTTGGGPGYATMVLPLEVYNRAFGGKTGQGAAAACIQLALGLILVALALLVVRSGESLSSGEPAGYPRQRVWVQAPDHRGRSPRATALPTGLLSLTLLLVFLPLGWLLVAAVQPGRSFALGLPPGFDPTRWDWGNFATVWNTGMGAALETSALFALGAVLGTICLAAPAAFGLTYLVKLPLWRYGTLVILLLGLLQPTSVLVIPLFSLLKDWRLLDSPWGVLLPEVARALPFAVLVLWGFLAQLPREVMQAAAVDGASARQQMLRVALPLVRPALYAVAIWSFVSSWNEYLLPTVVSQDGSIQTVPTLLGSFVGTYNTQFDLLAAGSLMAIAPSLLIYLLLRRPAAAGLSGAGRTGSGGGR